MLDEYGLRLLAEMGVDVYVSRTAAADVEPEVATSRVADVRATQDAMRKPSQADAPVAVGVVSAPSPHAKLLEHVGLAMRFAGIRSVPTDAAALDSIAAMRGLVVLGESLARALGANLPAQRQADIEWVITDEPRALAKSAIAKRALWGEIKRLARTFASAADGGARR